MVFFNVFPVGEGHLVAGRITPQEGLVEILREGETFVLEESLALQAGDCVRIGNRSEAEIVLGDMTSIAKNKTTVCIQEEGLLFLEKGSLQSQGEGAVSTERGVLRSQKNAEFSVTVSESGETKAVSQKKQLSVFDTKYRRAGLSAGEEVSLRTDTQFQEVLASAESKLSRPQFEALSLKLIISRTKALTALEALLAGNTEQGLRDILSAEKTFRSMVQVLDSSRDLQIIKRRHLRLISLSDVYDALYEKTRNTSLLMETRAVERLLSLLRQNKNTLSFAHTKSGVESFDRYALVKKLLGQGLHTEESTQVLQQKYINNFLRKIQSFSLKTEQISTLTQEVARLPHTEIADQFISQLQSLLPSDLAETISTQF